jgi:ABC-type dipeptide/oligopeptide/nickel transport system permease component
VGWRSIHSRFVRVICTLWLIVTAAFVCAFRRTAGLDQPIATQYARFVTRAARLDLGDSLVQRRPVTSLLRERGYQTLTLLAVASALLVSFGIIVPVLLQLSKVSIVRESYAALWTLAAVAPPYVLSIVALLLVAVRLSLVPVTFEPARASAWILPAAVLAAYPIAVTIRLLNEQSAHALQSPYVTTARALGYPERDVLLRFALPNALTPAMAAIANGLAFFVTGSFFVEVVFGIGGWGTLAYEAVRNKDIAVLVGVTIIFGTAICLVSALLQLALLALDPRATAREREGRG